MASIYRELHRTLKPICKNLGAVEYHFDGGLPDSILIYYIINKTGRGYFGNRKRRIHYEIGVDLLLREGEALDTMESAVLDALTSKGYIWKDNDTDMLIKDTGHYKRTMNFNYYMEV